MRRLVAAVIVVLWLVQPARAAVLFDDLLDASPTAASVIGYYPPTMLSDVVQGIQFQPSVAEVGAQFQVTQYSVAFRKHDDLPSPVVTFRLHDDAAGKPGNVLDVAHATIAIEGFNGGIYHVASTLNPTVFSGASYWLIAQVDENSNGALWHHAINAHSSKVTANRLLNGEWDVKQRPNGAALRVEGTPIPEPSSFGILAIVPLVLWRRLWS